MSPFAIQLINGCLSSDIEQEDQNSFQALQQLGAIEEVDGLWKLKSIYRVGRLYIGNDGKGYVETWRCGRRQTDHRQTRTCKW